MSFYIDDLVVAFAVGLAVGTVLMGVTPFTSDVVEPEIGYQTAMAQAELGGYKHCNVKSITDTEWRLTCSVGDSSFSDTREVVIGYKETEEVGIIS